MPGSQPTTPKGTTTSNGSSPTPIIDLSNTTVGPGYVVTNEQVHDGSGNVYTDTTFITTNPISDVQVTEDLSGSVISYYDNTQETQTASVLNEIQLYASKIQCEDFHGKGTIDDYSALFSAAAKIANETKQMQLDIDIDGFNEFADAADDLSKLFTSFIIKLENVSIINDTAFLTAVAAALKKIWNLSEVFGKFKKTILATSSIQLPKSAHDTKLALETVMGQVNCAMKYISHFVDASFAAPESANLSAEEQGIINKAVTTIDNWNVLCEQGVSIAMSNNPDIQYIKTASDELKSTTFTLKTATNTLKVKLAGFNLLVKS